MLKVRPEHRLYLLYPNSWELLLAYIIYVYVCLRLTVLSTAVSVLFLLV